MKIKHFIFMSVCCHVFNTFLLSFASKGFQKYEHCIMNENILRYTTGTP